VPRVHQPSSPEPARVFGEDPLVEIDGDWRWIRWPPGAFGAPRPTGGWDAGTTFTLVDSTDTRPELYDQVFPNRVSIQNCRRASAAGSVYGYLYSTIDGSFTDVGKKERLFRVASADCPIYGKPRLEQEIIVVRDRAIVMRTSVAERTFVRFQYDVDRDGITEAIVEFHRLATPAIGEGPYGIVSLRNGSYDEWYHGTFSPSGRCKKLGDPATEVALGVRPHLDGGLEVVEELWESGCDPNDATVALGGWHKVDERLTRIPARPSR
jgi:hypothetical protein